MIEEPQIKSYAEVEEAQKLLNENGCEHWFVTGTTGTAHDRMAYFRAERTAPNGKREVMHTEARVLLNLCREVDARMASVETPAQHVVSGVQNTEEV
jgi:hypothetical protein